MMDTIYAINGAVNGFVWGVPIICRILFTGVYFTIRLGAPQFRHIGFLFSKTVKKAFSKRTMRTDVPVRYRHSRLR